MRLTPLLLLPLLLTACTSHPAPSPPLPGLRIELLVHGIDCSGCARRVAAAVQAVPGVYDASVDRTAGRVIVIVDDIHPPTHQQLIDAIHAAGDFRVISIVNYPQ